MGEARALWRRPAGRPPTRLPVAPRGGCRTGGTREPGKGRVLAGGGREVVGDAGDARKLFDQLRGTNPVTEVKPVVFITVKGVDGGTATLRATV